jgi:hypothetical protein
MRGKCQNQTENPRFGDKELLCFALGSRNSDKSTGAFSVRDWVLGFQGYTFHGAIRLRLWGARGCFWRVWTDNTAFSAKVGQNRAFFVMKYSRKTEMPS